MPRQSFDRFAMNEHNRPPLFYSLQYHLEAELDENGQFGDSTEFVDLAAHYPQFAVHYVQDVTDGNNSWVIVTEGDTPLATTPIKRDNV